MMRKYCVSVSVAAIGLAAGLWSAGAQAATANDAAADNAAAPAEVSEVVVTGSLIQGTPQNAALPVTVLSSDNLAKQGSPNIVELTKMLPASSAIPTSSPRRAAARASTARPPSTCAASARSAR